MLAIRAAKAVMVAAIALLATQVDRTRQSNAYVNIEEFSGILAGQPA
jgi:hypothetical protein